jgi:hypothetical protein
MAVQMMLFGAAADIQLIKLEPRPRAGVSLSGQHNAAVSKSKTRPATIS